MSYFFLSLISAVLITASCTYKIAPKNSEQSTINHPLYMIIPRHRDQIRWYDIGHWTTWAIFGNDDSGLFGEDEIPQYDPEAASSMWKATHWFFRNPFHNFTFYVIGSADRKNEEYSLLLLSQERVEVFEKREGEGRVFASKTSSFFFCLHGLKPFISLRIRYNIEKSCDFYLGWRERGNFGIKLLPFTNSPKK